MTNRFLAALLFVGAPLSGLAGGFDAAEATNALGIDLYRQLAAKNSSDNLVISPYAIESALALAYAGADGDTRIEMARTLHLPLDNQSLQAGFATLRHALNNLARRSESLSGRDQSDDDRPFRWAEANRLYGQSGHAFRPAFLALMKDGFAAPFEALDFKGDPAGSRRVINTWVEDHTLGRITGLVPDGVSATTRLMLVNALYLKAQWDSVFFPNATRAETFYAAAGERAVPMMRQTKFLGYAVESGLTVVALDYLWGELHFLILLPDKGHPLEIAAAKLTPQRFARWAKLGEKEEQNITLVLPKFRVEGATLPLGGPLRALGLNRAFDVPAGSANFDQIAPRKNDDYLAISEIFHRTFVSVDEQGTEASSATIVALQTFGIGKKPKKPIEVRVDRPFLFAIQHRASGACLFLGRIVDPR